MSAVILPTHRCFDDALEYLEDLIRAQDACVWSHRLVHGIVKLSDGLTAHAWVERGDDVIQCGILGGERIYYTMHWDEFQRELQPQAMTRYTIREAWEQNKRHGTYGPWEQRYLDLAAVRGTLVPSSDPAATHPAASVRQNRT